MIGYHGDFGTQRAKEGWPPLSSDSQQNLCLLRARPRSRTRTRCGKGPHCWQDVNHSSHSSKAVQGAEILVHARLRKSKLIHEARVVKDSGFTVHVIRRTKLPIRDARRTTGDTVGIARPGPAHCVAHADVDGIRADWNSFFSGPTVTSRHSAAR